MAQSFLNAPALYPWLLYGQHLRQQLHRLSQQFWRQQREELRLVRFGQAVLSLPPVVVATQAAVEVITITSKQDVFLYLLAMKSLARVADFPFQVTVLDDGSLTRRQQATLRFHLPGIRIISQQTVDDQVAQHYGKRSMIYHYRSSPYIRKKIGMYLAATAPKILYCDSDVLFFDQIPEINRWAKQKEGIFFIQDPYNSYIISLLEAEYYFGWSPLQRLNSGLLGYPKKIFQPELLEKLVGIVNQVTRDCYRAPQMQIFFALLFAAQPQKNVRRLPSSYVVSDTLEAYQDCRVGHYVRSVRDRYFTDALNLIQKMKREQTRHQQ